MQQIKTCPKCNGSMIRAEDLAALSALYKESKGYNVKISMFIPARAHVCQQCGFMEYYKR